VPQWPEPLKISGDTFETGKPSGPYLFRPGIDGNPCVVGEWDGYICCTLDGERELHPVDYWDLAPFV